MTNVGPLGTMSYTLMTSVSTGSRTFVPVKPSMFGYSQFQYVAGYPAPNGQEGVSIDKVKILNTLIEHLVSMKQKNIPQQIAVNKNTSDDQIDALIKQYQNQIRTVAAEAENMPYKPALPQSGAVFNLVA